MLRLVKILVVIFLAIFMAFMLTMSERLADIYIPDVHKHGIVTHPFLNKWGETYEFKMVRTILPDDYVDEIVENPDKSWRAYMMCVPQENPNSGCLGKVYVENSQGDVYEVQSDAINPLRVFNDVMWATNDILVFDQWTHWGFHIAIDVEHQKLAQFMIIIPATPTPVISTAIP